MNQTADAPPEPLEPRPPKQARPAKQGSLYQQIKLARFWLPTAIVGVVLVYQLLVVPLGDERWAFWAQLIFYSVLGPSVTFATLNWIASEVRQREGAQDELRRLYAELQASHALLGAIQKVTEQFAAATDLDAVLGAASCGIAEVTGATHTVIHLGIHLGVSGLSITRGHRLTPEVASDALGRSRAFGCGERPDEVAHLAGTGYTVLSTPLTWANKLEGSLHAYYPQPPSADQRESYSILSSEFSAAAEAARSRTRDILTLFEVDRSIRAEGNLERLLETLLTQTMTRADATLGGVYLADEGGLLQLRACHGLGTAASSLRLGEGFIGEAAAAAVPRVAQHLSDDDRLGGVPILEYASSAVSLPLMTEEGLLGVVVLAHELPHHFDEANLPFLGLLAGQVTLAVRNARAYLQSEELAIAEERARIAREIHDGVAQSLAFAALKLDLIGRIFETHPDKVDKVRAELDTTKSTIRETIKEVRRSIFALRPIDLERHGFVETLRRYCDDYSQQNSVRVTLELEATPQLTLKSEAVLFRIFQEAMHNVAKHAHAHTVQVTVGQRGAHSFIAVQDDGHGFDPSAVSDRVTSAGGLGLTQMRERVAGRGGHFEAVSAPGRGTRVFASVPE